MQEEPKFRVAMCRMILRRVRGLPQADQILSRIDPEILDAIDHCPHLTWIPTPPLDAVATATLEVLGPEGYRAFYADHIVGWSESKLFRPLNSAAIRIFGSNPAGYLKWLSRAWEITTRGMGVLSTAEEGEGVRIICEGLPESHRTERVVLSSEGSIIGVVRARGKEPHITTDRDRLEGGRVIFDVRWS